MNEEQPLDRPHTRLSDFGAFRTNVADHVTHKMKSIDKDRVSVRSLESNSSNPAQNVGAVTTHLNRTSLQGPLKPLHSTVIQFPTPATTTGDRGISWVDFNKSASPGPVGPVAIQNQKRKKWVSFALRIGVTLLLLFFLFKSLSWSTLIQALAHVQFGELLLGLVIGVMGIVISSYQWRSLLHSERIKYDLADLIDLYMVGIAFNHFLPTGMGGDAVKAVQVGRTSGNSAGSTSAVVMSRFTGFIGMLLLALPVLLIWHGQFRQNVVLWFLLLSLLVLGMISGAIFMAAVLPKLYKGKWSNHRIFASIIKTGNALQSTVKRPHAMSKATLFGVGFWLVACLNHYAYGLALGIHVPLYFYFIAIPFIALVTFLPISINGFGLREGAFVFIFSTIHVASASSLLLALFMDAQALLFGLIGICIYLKMGSINNAKKTVLRSIA